MLDLAIRGGAIVDGTGVRRRLADIGVVGSRIVAIGEVGPARRDIDARGRIVAPGFVDVHSHFDAQVFWDPALTPSSLHGVTSTMAGNCGFTLAPLTTDSADYLIRMLAVVEGMPLPALRAGVPADWTTTSEYLGRVGGELAINVGFMVGHSALRRVVMGPEATSRPANPAELAAMVGLLRDGLEAGGLGFSSSWGVAHFDGDGRPVPSRSAEPEELIELARQCRDFPGTALEFLPARVDHFDDGQLDLLTAMSAGAERPLNWNVLRISAGNEAEVDDVLAAGAAAASRGARIVALNMPIPSRARFSFKTGFVLDALPGWGEVLGLPLPQRRAALGEPALRQALAAGAAAARGPLAEIAQFGERIITQTFSAATAEFQGRKVADLAAERGSSALDALLDVVCADDLETTFSRPLTEPSRDDWMAMAARWRDGHALIGASDAGAHLDFTAYFDYPVFVLEKAVRQHRALELEEAVRFLTDVPARLYGLTDRGRLVEGWFADVVVFDEHAVATGPIETRFDLPAGSGRLYAEPAGIEHVVVNGTVIVSGSELLDARPGRLLRSGRDTATATR